MLRVALILSLTTLYSCSAITPTASVIGATASVTSAYYDIKSNENVTILSKECIWYRPVKLSDEGKVGLTRIDKEQIAWNNVMYQRECP